VVRVRGTVRRAALSSTTSISRCASTRCSSRTSRG
jgi:hypothetical protein